MSKRSKRRRRRRKSSSRGEGVGGKEEVEVEKRWLTDAALDLAGEGVCYLSSLGVVAEFRVGSHCWSNGDFR